MAMYFQQAAMHLRSSALNIVAGCWSLSSVASRVAVLLSPRSELNGQRRERKGASPGVQQSCLAAMQCDAGTSTSAAFTFSFTRGVASLVLLGKSGAKN